MSPEIKQIALNQPFGYEDQDVVRGLDRTRKKHREFSSDLGRPSVDQDYTGRVVVRYGRAIELAERLGTEGVLNLLRELHQTVSELERQGVDSVEIARRIEMDKPNTIVPLRDIMHKGWIESLFQSLIAASY